MSGAKETPRQKMIGMMYLVYTALLAMNVSKDILDAFDTVNAGVQTTNITLSNQISQRYATFEDQLSKEPEKTRPYYNQAQALRKEADSLINYIEALKWDLVKTIEIDPKESDPIAKAVETGLLKDTITRINGRLLYNINTAKVKSRDNYNKPTEYMMGNPEGPGNGGKAFELSERIRRYRREVFKYVGMERIHEQGLMTDSIFSANEKDLEEYGQRKTYVLKNDTTTITYYGSMIDYAPETSDPIQKSWEYHNFHHTVLVADVTLLNKLISDVQTSELNAVTHLLNQIHAADYKFDEIGAKVFAESGYLLSGQTYGAQAMVTAWQNTPITAKVSLDGRELVEYKSDDQGVINLEFKPGVGSHKYTGTIEMFNPATNKTEEFPFENQFTVAPPAVSVSATKMNVVYRGINNPIAVGGGVGGAISASASSGTLTSTGNGTYNLLPGAADKVTISVSSGGQALGSMEFRVKDLPKPTVYIRNVVNGTVSRTALNGAGGITAEMKDFEFDGIQYAVVGFTMRYKTKAGTTKEAKANSGSFTDEMRNAINSSNVGDMFVFTAIQVKGPDGKVKTIETPIGVEIK